MMNCSDFDRRLQDVLDAQAPVDADELLERHAADCEPCREMLDAYAALVTSLEVLELPPPPLDLADRVCAQLPQRAALRHERRWLLGLAALAATALLAALPWLYRPAEPDRAGASGPMTSQPLGAVAASVAATGQPARSRDESNERMRVMIESLAGQISDVKLPLDGVNTITTAGFRPIASSLESALTAIRNSLPLIKSEEPRKPQASLGTLRLIG